MSPLQDWPALAGDLPVHLDVERAVWGKAHGASTDFRWLARSTDFGGASLGGLGRQLNLGPEDRPATAVAWRATTDAWYAVGCYPSRAADAAGRAGFLEKQVLEWGRRHEEPVAAAAFLLLAEVARLDDTVWWTRHADADWSDPDFALPIDAAERGVPAGPQALRRDVSAGLDELRLAMDEERLARLYAELLAGRRPVVLAADGGPLRPRALAALLLPLPRELADRLSLAASTFSSRPVADALGRRWDVIGGRQAQRAEPACRHEDEARRMARAVLQGDPGELRAEPTWDEWTAELQRDLGGTTARLLEKGLWEVWRRHARLSQQERLDAALAWLTSEVWSRADAPRADYATWDYVLDDVAVLGEAQVEGLFADGRPRWPWIPGKENDQIEGLRSLASNSDALALLERSMPRMVRRNTADSDHSPDPI